MNRHIAVIRHGIKHGPLTAYIDPLRLPQTNPFVLWDHVISTPLAQNELDFHGHSGIDAITYPITGAIHNCDSITGHCDIQAGDIQLTQCGKGMVHKSNMIHCQGIAESFQIWTASPQHNEMASPSNSLFKSADLPIIENMHTTVKVLVGSYEGANSPVEHNCNMLYLDVILRSYGCWSFTPPCYHTAGFIYLQSGIAYVANNQLSPHQLGIFATSQQPIRVVTTGHSARFLIALGEPLQQPMLPYCGSIHSSEKNWQQAQEYIQQQLHQVQSSY